MRETESKAVDFYIHIKCGQLAWKRGRGPHFCTYDISRALQIDLCSVFERAFRKIG